MIKLKSIFVVVLWFCILTDSIAASLDKRFQLLPLPQRVEVLNEEGIYGKELSFVVAQDAEIPILGPLLEGLPRIEKKGLKGVILSLSENDVPDSPEGYVLEVTLQGVTVQSRSKVGLFYGCQTLEQLLEDSRQFDLEIPTLKITDYPDIGYRAVHLDTKHHLDRTEYYYRLIDKLSRYKVNAIIWELEDKLRYTRRPEVGAPNAISKQEMRAICRYANERNINISPLVQGLGHASFILKHHWEFRESELSDWEFCPVNPTTYEVLFDLYQDAMEAMPESKYLHVGGDEISAIGIDERCKATGKTSFELQMEWLKKVCDFAVAHGKTPVFWDDMPLKYANLWWLLHRNVPDEEVKKNWNTTKLDQAIELFPKECIYMRWHYEDPTILPHRMLLNWYHKKGLKVMGATAASTGETPFMPRNGSRAQYIRDFCSLVVKNQLNGILATAWDDGSPHLETVTRGFIALGEYSWNTKGHDVENFKIAHAQREFGLTRKVLTFLDHLEKAAFFFDGALVQSGSRNPAWGVSEDFTLIDLPVATKPGEWSDRYRLRLDSARTEEKRYEIIQKGIKVAKQEALRNRYTLDVYEQTSHLFHYPTQLLLLFEAYDQAKNDEERSKAMKEIKAVCDNFKVMRKNLEDVYSKTRFMQNPEGYIADQNQHRHLSALTNNSDWWFLYEIPMIHKVREWLNK